ncbi:unnamed protein product [Caenorhabditis bovis]|uniref:ARC105/Med15 mediator subunit C-terminal domain-containing protein n=1 Tax=Caenorhabditis bovis TaxID=2654633 RepID=A0A8S1ETX4_9PELO|nr:unnamed protein product [Caenorhabditis bovis]
MPVKLPEIESFSQFFQGRHKFAELLPPSIEEIYAWSSSLELSSNNLPLPFISNNDEVVWSYIKHQQKQLDAFGRKFKGALDDLVGKEHIKISEKSDTNDNDDFDEEDVEDEEMSEIEDEDGEDEENVDLFNLKEEDLKDLDRELEEMENDDDNDDEEQSASSSKNPKKYPKSVVDDEFFNLAEMNDFILKSERGGGSEGPNLMFDEEDKWDGKTTYTYEDFFGSREDVDDKSEEKSRKKRKAVESDDGKQKKRVRFAMDHENEEDSDEELDDEEDEDISDKPVLLGAELEPEQEQSAFAQRQKKLKERIKKLEEENLAPRSWELSGEVAADQRESNTLLEHHVDFDHGAKRAPEVTEEFTDKLEELIKQRIRDKAFDDVVRVKKIEEKGPRFETQALEDIHNQKTSLAEVYEKEYQKSTGADTGEKNVVNEAHETIKTKMNDLFRLIDSLTHFEYKPLEAREEIKVVNNMASLKVEEVGAMASSEAQLIAPEEVAKRVKGTIKADEEKDKTDKLRERRKKKAKQRALLEKFGEEKTFGEQKALKLKKKMAKEKDSGKSEKVKSSNFFAKLQETMENEKKSGGKTKKKARLHQQLNDLQQQFRTGQISRHEMAVRYPQLNNQVQQYMHMQAEAARNGMMQPKTAKEKKLTSTDIRRNAAAAAREMEMLKNHNMSTSMPYPQGQTPASTQHGIQQRMPMNNAYPGMGQPYRQMGASYGNIGQPPQQIGVGMMHNQQMMPQYGAASVAPSMHQIMQQQHQQQQHQQQQHQQQQQQQQYMMNRMQPTPQPNMHYPQPSPQFHQPPSVDIMARGPQSICQPFSNQGPGSNQPDSSEKTPEYMELLNEYKKNFLERLTRIEERCERDRCARPKGFQQLMDVLAERRVITYDHLVRLKSGLVLLIAHDCVTWPLMEDLRKLMLTREQRAKDNEELEKRFEDCGKGTEGPPDLFVAESDVSIGHFRNLDDGIEVMRAWVEREEQECMNVGDPWKKVRHLSIKVPERVRRAIAEGVNARSTSSSPIRKRKSGEPSEVPAKRQCAGAEKNFMFLIGCTIDPQKKWNMPRSAMKELDNIPNWTAEPSGSPICKEASHAIIAIYSSQIMCPPIRIAVPSNYPEKPAYVLHDDNFAGKSTQTNVIMEQLFEKWASLRTSAQSITEIYEAFEAACKEYMCLQQTAAASRHFSSRFSASGDLAQATASSAVETSKIAHKGMVA